MTNLATRIERLEATQPGHHGGVVYRVVGGAEGSDARAFLRAQGCDLQNEDRILHRVIFAPGPRRVDRPMEWLR